MSAGLYRERRTTLRNPDVDSINEKLDGSPFDQKLEGRKKLILDPGLRWFKRGEYEPLRIYSIFQGSKSKREDGVMILLAELRSDIQGRLVFLPGSGVARSVQKTNQLWQPEIISEFDSVDWIDDICDGWVSVEVTHPDRPNMAKE